MDQSLPGSFETSGLRSGIIAGLDAPQLSGWIALLLAVLLIGRFIFWKPQLAMQRLDIGIMYLGYLVIIAQLLIEFLRQLQKAGLGQTART